jgi:hypothetical protein
MTFFTREGEKYSMWYDDPQAGRKGRRLAYREARRASRSRYSRPGGFLVLILFLIFYLFTHMWVWLLIGAIALVAVVLLLRPGVGQRFRGYQQPYVPWEEPEPFSPYEQGYHAQSAGTYQEGGRQFAYPSQSPAGYQQDDEPEAQYPEYARKIPPLQQ